MAVFRFERSYRIYEIFGRHDSYLDGLQCGKEMERDGNGGPLRLKKPFHQPLVEEKKVKEAKRKVVLFFYSFGQDGPWSL